MTDDDPTIAKADAILAPCCMCGTPVDTREIGDAPDVGPNGCELSDGRWTCSSECWERATEPVEPTEPRERMN